MRNSVYELVVKCPECKVSLPTEHVYVYLDEDGELIIEVASKCLHPKEGCSVNQDEHWEWHPFITRLTVSQIKEGLK